MIFENRHDKGHGPVTLDRPEYFTDQGLVVLHEPAVMGLVGDIPANGLANKGNSVDNPAAGVDSGNSANITGVLIVELFEPRLARLVKVDDVFLFCQVTKGYGLLGKKGLYAPGGLPGHDALFVVEGRNGLGPDIRV